MSCWPVVDKAATRHSCRFCPSFCAVIFIEYGRTRRRLTHLEIWCAQNFGGTRLSLAREARKEAKGRGVTASESTGGGVWWQA